MPVVQEAAGSARFIRSPNHKMRTGNAFKHCSKFHVKRDGRGRLREYYYHATKGWRSRAV